jgi:hypothetical protein
MDATLQLVKRATDIVTELAEELDSAKAEATHYRILEFHAREERDQVRRLARVLYRFYRVWREPCMDGRGPRGPFACHLPNCEFCKTQKDVERVLREEFGEAS